MIRELYMPLNQHRCKHRQTQQSLLHSTTQIVCTEQAYLCLWQIEVQMPRRGIRPAPAQAGSQQSPTQLACPTHRSSSADDLPNKVASGTSEEHMRASLFQQPPKRITDACEQAALDTLYATIFPKRQGSQASIGELYRRLQCCHAEPAQVSCQVASDWHHVCLQVQTKCPAVWQRLLEP